MKVAKFEKVSYEVFLNECSDKDGAREIYDGIVVPKRATMGSAGYDFASPFDFLLMPGEEIKIPTGIRAKINDGWMLMIFPRSGLGFKYKLRLNNTVGIIDSDYYGSSNQGHIMIKLTNESKDKTLEVKAGERFAQGIFMPYGITEDDCTTAKRDGGFGSTNS